MLVPKERWEGILSSTRGSVVPSMDSGQKKLKEQQNDQKLLYARLYDRLSNEMKTMHENTTSVNKGEHSNQPDKDTSIIKRNIHRGGKRISKKSVRPPGIPHRKLRDLEKDPPHMWEDY